jgi:hypothetical protein
MQHAPAKPGYDPATEQHREYMRGYHEVQEQILKENIKPVDNTPKGSQRVAAKPDGEPQAQPTRQPPAEAPKAPEPPPPQPTVPQATRSPMHMTRADWLRSQELHRQEEEAAAVPKEALAVASGAQPATVHQDPRGDFPPSTSMLNGSRPAFAGPVAVPDPEEEESSLFRRKAPAPAV